MNTPEALRLADEIAAMLPTHVTEPIAAELRRLHQFAEDQIGRATAAEAALQMTRATHALKIAAVEAQRDALLEALRPFAAVNVSVGFTHKDVDRARASGRRNDGRIAHVVHLDGVVVVVGFGCCGGLQGGGLDRWVQRSFDEP